MGNQALIGVNNPLQFLTLNSSCVPLSVKSFWPLPPTLLGVLYMAILRKGGGNDKHCFLYLGMNSLGHLSSHTVPSPALNLVLELIGKKAGLVGATISDHCVCLVIKHPYNSVTL